MELASILRRPVWVVVCLGLLGCSGAGERYQQHAGATMGTQYRVTARCPADVGADISSILERVNAEMSTYDPASTLSRFNRSEPGEWFAVSPELVAVVASAVRLHAESAGAFDVTVGPLVNLWGFGPEGFPGTTPTPAAIQAALDRVGTAGLEFRQQPAALRKRADLYVDLSAIAKGHGVDRVAGRLTEVGCEDFLIEIGGEVRARGKNERGDAWRIGVEVPDPASYGAVQRVLVPGNNAVATSGDYRNFLEVDGERVSHTIDPRTGRPVSHTLASVTVVHTSAMWADGYATLLNVLGPDAGFEFATEHALAALFVVHSNNDFEERYTAAMQPVLGGR